MRNSTLVLAVLLLSGCEEKVIEEVQPPTAVVAPESTTEKEPEKVSEEPRPEVKKKRLNRNRCNKINHQFNQCGWRCVHRGGSVGRCINTCRHMLTRKGNRCFHMFGPGFG